MKQNKSMALVAEEVLKEKGEGLDFGKLYSTVAERLEMTQEEKDDRIGDFHTDLTMDGRFFTPNGSKWDLREWHASDVVIKSVFHDDSDDDSVEEGGDEAASEEQSDENEGRDDSLEEGESQKEVKLEDLGVNI